TTTGTTLGSKDLDPTGHASLTVNDLTTDTPHTIEADFAATVSFQGSSGLTFQTVSPGTVSVRLQTSQSPTVFGQPVTFTATVAPQQAAGRPSGSLAHLSEGPRQATLGLKDDEAVLKALELVLGGHAITATYTPDTENFTGSSTGSPALEEVVS